MAALCFLVFLWEIADRWLPAAVDLSGAGRKSATDSEKHLKDFERKEQGNSLQYIKHRDINNEIIVYSFRPKRSYINFMIFKKVHHT